MSRTLGAIAVFGVGIGAILIGAAAVLGGDQIPGILQDGSDQKLVTRDLAWDGGESIEIETSATVHYAPGQPRHVLIRAPANVLDRVELHDGVLGLSGSHFWRHDHVDVTLSGITMRDITLDGSGKIFLDHIDQDRLAVEIRGSGAVEGSGRVDSAALRIKGSGHVRLGQLMAQKADIEISGSGEAEIAAIEEADVSISGSGTVRFPNAPKKIATRISGSGRVLNGSDKD